MGSAHCTEGLERPSLWAATVYEPPLAFAENCSATSTSIGLSELETCRRSLLALPAWNSGLTTPRSSWNQGMVTYLRYFQPRSELRSSRSPRFLRLRRTGSYPCYALSELWESTLSIPPPLGMRNRSLLPSVTAPKGIRSRSRDSLSG